MTGENICPGGSGNDDLPSAGIVHLPGSTSSFDITGIAQLDPRATIIAEVFSVVGANTRPVPQITISQGSHFAKIQIISETHESGQQKLANWNQEGRYCQIGRIGLYRQLER